MNHRERAVVLLVTAAFLAGVAISYGKRVGLRRQAALHPIAVLLDSATGRTQDPPAVLSPVDINQATPRQLDRLPGIGPVLASRIVDYRQRKGGFRSVSELRAVSGIGEKRYSTLKDLVRVGSDVTAAESGR